jgi:hypothetical protein
MTEALVWTKIEDDLPLDNQEVLVRFVWNDNSGVRYIVTTYRSYENCMLPDYIRFGTAKGGNITHWMPLQPLKWEELFEKS